MSGFITETGIKLKYETSPDMLYVEIWGDDKTLIERVKTRAARYQMAVVMWLDGQTWKCVVWDTHLKSIVMIW